MTSLSMIPNISINGAQRLHDFTACYWLTMHHGTCSMKWLWAQDWNLMKVFFLCYHFDFGGLNMSQICTCHDSLAVMAYAKLWPDLMIMFYVKAMCILTKFGSRAYRLFVKLAPGRRPIFAHALELCQYAGMQLNAAKKNIQYCQLILNYSWSVRLCVHWGQVYW